ncbi:dehydrogenase with different specificitie [Stachybotrys elegans]|uniref:Dehydrogenase with different specificitie n=1 Tax=Stachybotrys elegans TaxID=80388 RepID=A0A8K0SVY7_9HYPO|nr:dehydrogenase with different specificitie [Stachybotrys elegans]
MATRLPRDELFAVDGLVAVVTGGGSGLGLMMASTLAANGASKVYIVGRREDRLKQAAAALPGVLIPLPGDVTSQASLQSLADRIRNETGHLDLLIANAGMSGPGLGAMSPRATASEFARAAWATPMADFDAVYALNCTATYYTIVAFLDLLSEGNRRRRPSAEPHSQVIVTSSMVAFQRDPRYGFAYLSSKAALVSMVKSFATRSVDWGIRFNSIAPGLFPTEMSASALLPFRVSRDKELDEEGAFARSFLPAERAGSHNDIAGVLLYLASKAGAYVNGSIMLVDGGKMATVPSTY